MIEHEKAVMPNDVAAISVGLIGNDVYLDLDYVLDSNADVDMNVIMTSNGEFVEIQGTGEESTFTGDQLNRLIELSKTGISKLHKFQSELFEKLIPEVKKNCTTKFDESIDLAVRLGVDPKQANQMVRGVTSLPHGTGKNLKVLALVTADKEEEAKKAGADYVGCLLYTTDAADE